jgi:hypothetical protein
MRIYGGGWAGILATKKRIVEHAKKGLLFLSH